jgi:gas vesicle protein
MYREEQSGASFMLGILTGAFVGAGVALLFAPKTGTEMRQQLGEQYRGLADRVGEQAQGLRETANTLREQGRERVQQLTGQLSDRMSSSPTSSASTSTDRQGSQADRFPTSAPSV